MSLEQYNTLMSRMLNQWHALAKLRTEIERRERRVCQGYKRFRYLACNCRNKRKKEKGKLISQNKFEVIASRVMRCGVIEEIKVRRQETIEEVKCFRCWGIGHYKQECPNIEVNKKKRREKEAACVARLQKVQQEKRLVHFLWRKAQEYNGAQSMPLRSAALEQRG